VANLSPALTELATVVSIFADQCIDTLEWNRERLAELSAEPFDSLIAQATTAGYDAVANRRS
ncbi:hypothetical protein, partial [Bacillus sp. SIMBA_005]|uniref:hypothetical protein n=1 Tax=Bacillus sp. SIMBA_005 TaxID=3085754 RepID=UPI00397824CB